MTFWKKWFGVEDKQEGEDSSLDCVRPVNDNIYENLQADRKMDRLVCELDDFGLKRDKAYNALLALGEDAVPTITWHLKDRRLRSYVRADLARLLGEIGDSTAVPSLIECLDDDDIVIQARVAYALGKLGRPEFLPEICKKLYFLFESTSWKDRGTIANALTLVGVDNLRANLSDREIASIALRAMAYGSFNAWLGASRDNNDKMIDPAWWSRICGLYSDVASEETIKGLVCFRCDDIENVLIAIGERCLPYVVEKFELDRPVDPYRSSTPPVAEGLAKTQYRFDQSRLRILARAGSVKWIGIIEQIALHYPELGTDCTVAIDEIKRRAVF